jgi:hypothetical protein
MKKIVSILFALSLVVAAWGQNPMERTMEAFPTGKETHILCQEACAKLQNNPALAPELVTEALLSGNRQYSNAVLTYADETAGAKALVKAIKKVYPTLTDAAKADVLYWIGRNKLMALQKFVDEGVNAKEVTEASMAAVFAAVQMGGKHNQEILDQCVKAGSPLFPEIQRLRGQVSGDDDDSTRKELRDQK